MSWLYQEYFVIPEEDEKIPERVLNMRIGVAVLLIIAMLAAMSFSAYAYFSSAVVSASNQIKAAAFDVEITINGQTVSGSSLDLSAGTYTVTLTENGTASTGFCRILVNGDEYHTQQLGVDRKSETGRIELIRFTLDLKADTTVQFIPNWGTSAYYDMQELEGTARVWYICDGDTVVADTKPEETVTETKPEETEPIQTTGPVQTTESTQGVYVVRQGDTLEQIAERFNTTVRAIAVLNQIEDVNYIQAGQQLLIPIG